MLKKTVIITGSAGGIGSATAKKFAENGYNLALTYNKTKCDTLLKELSSFDVKVKTYKLDISKPKEIAKVFAQIFSDFEYVDCLVANAGVYEPETMLIEKTDEEIEKVLNTNLFGTIICNRECLKHFINQKHGNIVNISSIQGQEGTSCNSVYSASKAGIIALSEALAKEVASFNIRVNIVAPGFIDTPMTSCFDEEEKTECCTCIPLGRIGKSEEIANAVFFLASSEASYITGANISVNGGAVLFM